MFQSNRTRDNVTFTGKLDMIYAISPNLRKLILEHHYIKEYLHSS